MSEPVSGSPYIIICGIETAVALGFELNDRVIAVSKGAAEYCGWMQSYYKHFNPTDLQTISMLQHQLMDWSKGEIELSDEQVDQKVHQLIAEFRVLEDKY